VLQELGKQTAAAALARELHDLSLIEAAVQHDLQHGLQLLLRLMLVLLLL
jgi:hypothetical protein